MKRKNIEVVVAQVLVNVPGGMEVGEARRMAELAECDAFVFNGRMWPSDSKRFTTAWGLVFGAEPNDDPPQDSETAPRVEHFEGFSVYGSDGNRKPLG